MAGIHRAADAELVPGGFDHAARTHTGPGRTDAAIHDGDGIRIIHVRPQHRRPARTGFIGRDVDGRALLHRHRGSLSHIAAPLPAAARQHRAAAGGAAGIEAAAARQGDVVAFEHDTSTLVLQALGFNNAAVVDHRRCQAVCRPGGHHYQASVYLYQPFIFGQGINRPLVDRVAEQAIACKVERNPVAGGKNRTPPGSGDRAFVDGFGRNQRNHAARHGGYESLVDNGSRVARGAKEVFSGQEITVQHIQ